MEVFCTEEKLKAARLGAQRELRSYKKMNSVLLASQSYFNPMDEEYSLDTESIRAQTYAIKTRILSLPDTREKLFLYQYYVHGLTLEECARILGVSRRSIYRIKTRALTSYAEIMKK